MKRSLDFFKIVKGILVFSICIFISCTQGLERAYKKSSTTEDLEIISRELSEVEMDNLKVYIANMESENKVIEGKSYKELLVEAKEMAFQLQLKKEEEALIEQKRIDSENRKKKNEALIKLLCSKEWRIKSYAFQVKIWENSEENIAIAKEILNKAMIFKGSEFDFSVEEDNGKTYVRGTFDKKIVRFFNSNNERIKEYKEDGTYIERAGEEEETGTWEFTEDNRIREARPTASRYKRNKKDIFYIDIKTLTEDTFYFFEEEYSNNPNEIITSAIVMKLD